MPRTKPKREASQRQLQVGEVIRHALSDIITRGKLYEPELQDVAVTVSEVRVSPDLKAATVFVSSFDAKDMKAVVTALNRISPDLRNQVNRKVNLRFSPKMTFTLDDTFERVYRIDTLLHQAKPAPEDADEDGEEE